MGDGRCSDGARVRSSSPLFDDESVGEKATDEEKECGKDRKCKERGCEVEGRSIGRERKRPKTEKRVYTSSLVCS